jgi:hypothetical protein
MRTRVGWLLLYALASAVCAAPDVSPAGRVLEQALDRYDLDAHWQAGSRVDWASGVALGPSRHPGATHCSAFAAAVAQDFGVYLLHPPEHGVRLLANAQSDWLPTPAARAAGWHSVAGAASAQDAANRGWLVLAVYRNPRDDRPGHIAIVRPGRKDDAQLASEGPDVIQAGRENARRIALARGFAGHPAAWRRHEVAFYAHVLALAPVEDPARSP